MNNTTITFERDHEYEDEFTTKAYLVLLDGDEIGAIHYTWCAGHYEGSSKWAWEDQRSFNSFPSRAAALKAMLYRKREAQARR
mgnify:CR=1 FL=1